LPEVSLTPLIDTALTLLIIFMVATPMIHNSLKIELPKGSLQEAGKEPQKIVISIDTNGLIYVNNQRITLNELTQTLQRHISGNNQEQSVWVHASAKSPCELLVGVIERAKEIKGIRDVNIAMQKVAPVHT
jgi:biopolymer transport protein ExbD